MSSPADVSCYPYPLLTALAITNLASLGLNSISKTVGFLIQHVLHYLANHLIGKYIVQVARFDPAKGIPTVIDSYAEFRRRAKDENIQDIPQLVVYVTKQYTYLVIPGVC